MSEGNELKKELAKKKRIASDIASEIHDVVEDRFFDDYRRLTELSEQAIKAVEDYRQFKEANGF